MSGETRVDRLLRAFAVMASIVAAVALVCVLFNLWLGARRIGEPAIFFAVFSWVALGVRRMMHSAPQQAREDGTPPDDSPPGDIR